MVVSQNLLHAKDPSSATAWLQAYNDWCERWKDFLAEKTLNEETGKMGWTHERLVTARNGLNTLIRRGHLFTFLDPELTADGPLPSTNNKLEGGVNAPLRDMLRLRRGMSTLRRVKAVFWWCYMHSENPLPPAEVLAVMPTDGGIAELYRRTVYEPQEREGPVEWGDGVVWVELHHSTPWRMDWDQSSINTFWPITRSLHNCNVSHYRRCRSSSTMKTKAEVMTSSEHRVITNSPRHTFLPLTLILGLRGARAAKSRSAERLSCSWRRRPDSNRG